MRTVEGMSNTTAKATTPGRVRVGEVVTLEVYERGDYVVSGAHWSDCPHRTVCGVVQSVEKARSGGFTAITIIERKSDGDFVHVRVNCVKGARVSIVPVEHYGVADVAQVLTTAVAWAQIAKRRGIAHPMLNSRQRSFIYAPKVLTVGQLVRLTGSQEQAELLATLCYEWEGEMMDLVETVQGLAA